jgi:hypothetical protein
MVISSWLRGIYVSQATTVIGNKENTHPSVPKTNCSYQRELDSAMQDRPPHLGVPIMRVMGDFRHLVGGGGDRGGIKTTNMQNT